MFNCRKCCNAFYCTNCKRKMGSPHDLNCVFKTQPYHCFNLCLSDEQRKKIESQEKELENMLYLQQTEDPSEGKDWRTDYTQTLIVGKYYNEKMEK